MYLKACRNLTLYTYTILLFRSVPMWQCYINSYPKVILIINQTILLTFLISSWWLIFLGCGCMHDPMVDIGFCLLYMYVPVVILYRSLGGGEWTCVNQWSGIDHCHLWVSMYVGSACHGWLVWVGLNYSRVINGHMLTTAILKMSESQYVV